MMAKEGEIQSVTASEAPSGVGFRVAVLSAMILFLSLLHYFTPPEHFYWHVLYQHLYYLPVLLGAGWFGVRGGISVALAATVFYIPHVLIHWSHSPLYRFSQLVSIVMFVLFGFLAGALIDRLKQEREGHRRTAAELQQAYQQLHSTFDRLRLVDRLSALGALSAGMAHEIRNPLGSVAGAVEILESGLPEGDANREFVLIIKKEIQRLSSIVSRQLDLVRPTHPERTPLDIRRIVESVENLTRKQAERQGVKLEVQAGAALPLVMADDQQIRQAVLNLVINALQAVNGGGVVAIRSESDGRCVRIVVEDDGPGLSEEALGRAMEPFYTTKDGGTGLGLSIAFQIAIGHGGDLRVENRESGGARLTLELPVHAAPDQSEAAMDSPGAGTRSRP